MVTIKSLRILTETNQDLPGWLNISLIEGSEFDNCKIFIIMVIMRKCQIVKGGDDSGKAARAWDCWPPR